MRFLSLTILARSSSVLFFIHCLFLRNGGAPSTATPCIPRHTSLSSKSHERVSKRLNERPSETFKHHREGCMLGCAGLAPEHLLRLQQLQHPSRILLAARKVSFSFPAPQGPFWAQGDQVIISMTRKLYQNIHQLAECTGSTADHADLHCHKQARHLSTLGACCSRSIPRVSRLRLKVYHGMVWHCISCLCHTAHSRVAF